MENCVGNSLHGIPALLVLLHRVFLRGKCACWSQRPHGRRFTLSTSASVSVCVCRVCACICVSVCAHSRACGWLMKCFNNSSDSNRIHPHTGGSHTQLHTRYTHTHIQWHTWTDTPTRWSLPLPPCQLCRCISASVSVYEEKYLLLYLFVSAAVSVPVAACIWICIYSFVSVSHWP